MTRREIRIKIPFSSPLVNRGYWQQIICGGREIKDAAAVEWKRANKQIWFSCRVMHVLLCYEIYLFVVQWQRKKYDKPIIQIRETRSGRQINNTCTTVDLPCFPFANTTNKNNMQSRILIWKSHISSEEYIGLAKRKVEINISLCAGSDCMQFRKNTPNILTLILFIALLIELI